MFTLSELPGTFMYGLLEGLDTLTPNGNPVRPNWIFGANQLSGFIVSEMMLSIFILNKGKYGL